MKKVLYYIGAILTGILSGAFYAEIFTTYAGIISLVLNLIIGSVLAYVCFWCYKRIDRINKLQASVNIPISNSVPKNVSVNRNNNFNESLSLVNDCLSYRQTMEYPEIENQLTFISNYLNTFKDKGYEVNQYITDMLNHLLMEYKEVVTSPAKDTPQGKEIISQIENSLSLINGTLGKIYKAILDGKQLEVASMVQGLKSKLTVDGYINEASNPFRKEV